jgi:hypothetical protein
MRHTIALALASEETVYRTGSYFLSPSCMGFRTGFPLRGGVLIATCALLASSLASAHSTLTADSLEREIIVLKRQWAENQRKHTHEQNRLHEEANLMRAQLCTMGRRQYCPGVDIKKLARAVAVAETQNCTTGVGASMNNCQGIKQCQSGRCEFRRFESPEDSYAAFSELWLRGYGDRFPTINDARRYTANDGERWLGIVTTVYHRQ